MKKKEKGKRYYYEIRGRLPLIKIPSHDYFFFFFFLKNKISPHLYLFEMVVVVVVLDNFIGACAPITSVIFPL